MKLSEKIKNVELPMHEKEVLVKQALALEARVAELEGALRDCKEKLLTARAEFDCNPNYFDGTISRAQTALAGKDGG